MEPEKLLGCERGRSRKLDLRLNLSPVNSSTTTSEMTVERSSWETGDDERMETRAMLLVGCRRCLMYVLLSDVDPKCPKCRSTVLLDFLNDDISSSSTTTNKPNN